MVVSLLDAISMWSGYCSDKLDKYLSDHDVEADLSAGRLERVLEEWTPPFAPLALYYPGRRHVPAPLRALVELIRETG